jgi:hypothetical protein
MDLASARSRCWVIWAVDRRPMTRCRPVNRMFFLSACKEQNGLGPGRAERQLRQQVRAIWSVARLANYAALEVLQDAGLNRFSPVKPQHWVTASFEHHRGPHGLPHPTYTTS